MEIRELVDQRRQQIDRFFFTHAACLARQGAVVAGFRNRAGHRLGPYYRLTCRSGDGRQISIYLGTDARIVAEARCRLAELQDQLRQRRRWKHVRRAIRREINAARCCLRAELAKLGLSAKGAEIRGWRNLGEAGGREI